MNAPRRARLKDLAAALPPRWAAQVWAGGDRDTFAPRPHLSTGWPELDAELPGGGWPLGAITELLCDQQGIGELRLLMPSLASLSRNGRWLVWLGAPHIPYPPALAANGIVLSRVLWLDGVPVEQRLWAAEQTLRHSGCGAVLIWLSERGRGVEDRALRRIQLAAESGGGWALVFRGTACARRVSPAALRVRIEVLAPQVGAPEAIARARVQILKCRGPVPSHPVHLSLPLRTGSGGRLS